MRHKTTAVDRLSVVAFIDAATAAGEAPSNLNTQTVAAAGTRTAWICSPPAAAS